MGLRNRLYPSDSGSFRQPEPSIDTLAGICRQDSPFQSRKILLVDGDESHARRIIKELVQRGLEVEHLHTVRTAISRLKQHGYECEIVILNISNVSQPWLEWLELLQEAAHQSSLAIGPLFLCLSTTKREPFVELQVERLGGRLVYE